MSTYRGTADRPAKAKAVAAVAAVHLVLAAVILGGLKVETVSRVVERVQLIDIRPPPPKPKPPPPPPRKAAATEPQGAPARKAEASPIVAPAPRIPVRSRVAAARVAGAGSAASSGAGTSGAGTGAGGSGSGPGGGGVDYSKYTPARRISKIPDREYWRLSATGIQSGAVGITILVNFDGSPSNCRVALSSGDRGIDALMCQLTLRYVRFQPARDPDGRPVAQEVTFYPNWYRP